MPRKPSDLMCELDGPGATPRTVDSLLLLRLAEVSFRLMSKVADANRFGLTLRGLSVLDKCVAIAATPSSSRSAVLTATKTLRILRGDEDAPRGTEGLLEDVRRQVRELPAGVSASFRIGRHTFRMAAPDLPPTERPWESTELRVRPMRVGGAQPTVELASRSERSPFTVSATREIAAALGALLYQEVDVSLRICRDIDGRIERGEVRKVYALQDADPTEAWTSWLAPQGWDRVDDVLGELDRRN